jgi:hypothetical protein
LKSFAEETAMSADELAATVYTQYEVAKIYRKSVKTIREWARTGKLPGVIVIARQQLFSRTAIEKHMAGEQGT